MRMILFALALLGLALPSHAQQPVTTLPSPVLVCPSQTSCPNNASSTIASTNTFQNLFTGITAFTPGSGSGRRGCLIVNTSANVMYVYVGPIALATTSNSVALAAAPSAGLQGGAFNCNGNGIVVVDQISITGTSGGTFAAFQE